MAHILTNNSKSCKVTLIYRHANFTEKIRVKRKISTTAYVLAENETKVQQYKEAQAGSDDRMENFRQSMRVKAPSKFEKMALMWAGKFETSTDIPARVSIASIQLATDKVRIILNIWVAFVLLIGATTFCLLQRARYEKIRKSTLKRQLENFARQNKIYEAQYAERKRREREQKEAEARRLEQEAKSQWKAKLEQGTVEAKANL